MELQQLLDNFPKGSPRPMQKYVLREVANAFNSGKKFIILEAPTGFGKSVVGVTIGRTIGSSFLCTTTKSLQDQYANDFDFVRKVVGSKNFHCSQFHGEDDKKEDPLTCSAGAGLSCPDRKYDKQAMEIPDCPYVSQKLQALRNPHTLLNYHYFLSLLKYTEDIEPGMKQLLIADEAHELPNIIKDFHSISLSQYYIRQILPGQTIPKLTTSDVKPWVTYFKNLLGAIRQVQKINEDVMSHIQKIVVAHGGGQSVDNAGLEKMINDFALQVTPETSQYINVEEINKEVVDRLSGETLGHVKAGDVLLGATYVTKRLTAIATVVEKLDFFLQIVEQSPDNWVIDTVPDNEDPDHKAHKIQMLPLNVDRYARELFSNTEYVLLMSATILDARTFARTLGLDESEYVYIPVPSSFPAENRPIRFRNVGSLNHKEIQGNLPLVLKEVERILNAYPDKKGIIHTHTKAIMNYIYDNISPKNKARLLRATADAMFTEDITNNEENDDEQNAGVQTNYQQKTLKRHAESTIPTVLISPSLHTGIDLKDDLSRFQIIVKVPYPSLVDHWVAKKKELDPQWYKWQVALRLIQMYGRSVRSETDWAHTYILDSSASQFIKSNSRLFPQWVREAFVN